MIGRKWNAPHGISGLLDRQIPFLYQLPTVEYQLKQSSLLMTINDVNEELIWSAC